MSEAAEAIQPCRLTLAEPPNSPKHGDTYAYLPPKYARTQHELALTIAWICHRKLWGQTYAGLQPDYFWTQPQDAGVLLRPVVTTSRLFPGATKPGDVDLLVIPYHGKELVLERSLAMEIKVIRASHARPGKSPNDFGFSQAEGLSALGFPYVAVVHLIVSDSAPENEWRMMGKAEVLDSSGRVRMLEPEPHDMLPADLMERAFGRLKANSRDGAHGIAAVYLDKWSEESRKFEYNGFWFPECQPALRNPSVSYDLLPYIGSYYLRNSSSFLATPMFDPPNT
ncbi:hypothetical protein [Devosia rhizoryzae]|uniref:hypothetical protein n=1 Tax=Devosia rhizoryzae TaxID=2774137 RepID=UPI001AED17EB|nr:hypothetical protein [Devosia rhizoryzae]